MVNVFVSLTTCPLILAARYCNKCAMHVEATKTLAVWSSPDILVLHLKRFEYRNIIVREKLNTLITFPLVGLDMSPYVRYSQAEFLDASATVPVPGSAPPIYDLFGVVNHMGTMAGGHYTAYANAAVGRGVCDDAGEFWHYFDDSRVKRVRPDEVITQAAYVLFYRRRDTREASPAAAAAGSGASRSSL